MTPYTPAIQKSFILFETLLDLGWLVGWLVGRIHQVVNANIKL